MPAGTLELLVIDMLINLQKNATPTPATPQAI